MRFRNNRRGFTIIEVVIVLALAAFIFTIVFFAVPQLQRALRDNQRGSDTARVVTELLNYQSQNDGDFPATAAELTAFQNGYLDGLTLDDPETGNPYTYALAAATGDDPAAAQMLILVNATCDGELFATGGGDRDIAVRTPRDNGSTYICRDNS